MLTYSGLQSLYQTLTNDTSAANATAGGILMSNWYRQLCAQRPWYWLEQTSFATSTVAGQQGYAFPYDYDKLIDLFVTVNNYNYSPQEVVDQTEWDVLNGQTTYTGNVPQFFHVYEGRLLLYPVPSVSAQPITYNYRRRVVDLTIPDYSTGTISVIGAAVTGAATAWNATMVGKWLSATPSSSVASNGDGFWYQVSAVGSATGLTLNPAYGGVAPTAASYVVGQVSALPEAFQDFPAYMAARDYYTFRNPDLARARAFTEICTDKMTGLLGDSKKTANTRIVVEADRPRAMSPNNYQTYP